MSKPEQAVEHVGGHVEQARITAIEVAAFRAFVEGLATETDEDRANRQLTAILTATTAEDIVNANMITKAEEVLDHRLRVESVRSAVSDYESGPDFYLIFDAYDETDHQLRTVECGAADVVVKVARLAQLGLLPVTLKIHRKDKATKAGFFPLFAELAAPAFD
jgi:hypothetical protein